MPLLSLLLRQWIWNDLFSICYFISQVIHMIAIVIKMKVKSMPRQLRYAREGLQPPTSFPLASFSMTSRFCLPDCPAVHFLMVWPISQRATRHSGWRGWKPPPTVCKLSTRFYTYLGCYIHSCNTHSSRIFYPTCSFPIITLKKLSYCNLYININLSMLH